MNASKIQPIIIVKKKINHGGHHGGAWKVAYADFVTAMMAFFLVMWLVGQSKPVKQSIGGYFRDPGVFETQGGKGVLPGGTSVDPEQPNPETTTSTMAAIDAAAEKARMEQVVTHIREALDHDEAFAKLRNQVEFKVTPEGLRIDLVEQPNSSFFDSGSATMRPETEQLLAVVAEELAKVNHSIDIEGHTDSRAYSATDKYSNWELSTDRANAARRVMDREGLRRDQVSSVKGFADRELRFPDDPLDPRNRRVSILVKNPLFKSTPSAPAQASVQEHDVVK